MNNYNTRNKKEALSYDELLKLFDERLQNIATKQCINELKSIIEDQKKIISNQQKEIDTLKDKVKFLTNENDSFSQYGRRTCLRIVGIPPAENETGEECLDKINIFISDANLDIPSCCVDRAHRIGKPFKRKDGTVAHTVIVKFSTWRHRTLFYRARRNEYFKKKKLQTYIDLTKHRLNILNEAKAKVDTCGNVDYVFANVNCQLCIKFKNSDQLYFFNDLDDLDILLDHE